jgi:hypothetical protein
VASLCCQSADVGLLTDLTDGEGVPSCTCTSASTHVLSVKWAAFGWHAICACVVRASR